MNSEVARYPMLQDCSLIGRGAVNRGNGASCRTCATDWKSGRIRENVKHSGMEGGDNYDGTCDIRGADGEKAGAVGEGAAEAAEHAGENVEVDPDANKHDDS